MQAAEAHALSTINDSVHPQRKVRQKYFAFNGPTLWEEHHVPKI